MIDDGHCSIASTGLYVWASYTLILAGNHQAVASQLCPGRIDPTVLASCVVKWMCGSTVDVLQETLLLCSIYDHKSVIHIPLPNSWRVLICVDGLVLKILHIQVGHNWADGRPHGCSLELLKEPTLELEICGL